MKNNIFLLFKTNLKNRFKFNNKSKIKKSMTPLLILYVVLCIMFSLFTFFKGMFEILSKVNLINYYLPVLFAITSIFVLFFSIFSSKSMLFDNKDNDLLLSLPIKKSDILFSRLLYLIGYNFLISLLIMLSGLFVYLSKVNVGAIFYIYMLIVLVLLPCIPSILSSLFGYFIAFITSKAKNKSAIELLSYTLFIVVYMLAMTKSKDLLNYFVTNVDVLNNIIKYLFYPIYLLSLAFKSNSHVHMLYFIVINILFIYLFLKLLSIKYYNIISKLQSHMTSSNYKMSTISVNSVKKALRIKELKKYFSSAIYVFNTIFGSVIFLIVAVASLFYNVEQITSVMNIEGGMSTDIMILYFVMFVTSLTITTNSAISIERNNFWILKMLPISVQDIFESKKFVNKVVLIPFVILGLIIFSFSKLITVPQVLLLSILCIIYNEVICNFGLICNLLFPKLDAVNDTAVVKQSAASFIGICAPLFTIAITMGILSEINIKFNIIVYIFILSSIVLMLILRMILSVWGKKKFLSM